MGSASTATNTAEEAPDYYELLSISVSASESEIRRAYRKTSLLYHPDKVANFTPDIAEKFQHVQKALDVLTNADEKQKYDRSREAKLRRKAEHDALESRRRKLKEDLEAGEQRASASADGGNTSSNGGTKRTWTQRDLDIQRIAEENRRKRQAASLRKAQEAQERAAAAAAEAERKENEGEESSSIDRSVKIRWIREGDGLDVDKESLLESFPAGEVEDVVVLKDKKRRIDGREKKVIIGTGVVIFTSKSAAKQAVARGPWDGIQSVSWAAEKEADPS